MARKHTRRSKNSDGARGWLWMLFGLSLGLVIAASIYFSGHRVPAGPEPTLAREPSAPTLSREPVSERRPVRETDTAASEPHPARRFDFYDMLPQFEVVIPESPPDRTRDSGTSRIEEAGNYVLQAGAFTVIEDADRMQASLALLGIESRIQSVPIDDDVYHRVRIGPMDDLDELHRIRRRLWEADIDTMLVRVPN